MGERKCLGGRLRTVVLGLVAGLVSLGLFQATAVALPIINISDASVVEGDNEAAFLDFNVSLSEASTTRSR